METQTMGVDPSDNKLNIPQIWLDRFLAKIDKNGPNGCWIWTAAKSHDGYGRHNGFPYGSTQYAHRIAYELCFGLVPKPLEVHHKCENRICCNPAHLEPVTRQEHFQKSPNNPTFKNAEATHCVHGHAFDERNTYRDKLGKRVCRT